MHSLLLENLETALETLKQIPLWGSAPPFPLEALAEALSTSFEVDPLTLSLQQTEFREDPLEGMGEDPFIRPFVLSPLPGEFLFTMPRNQLHKLATALLDKEGESKGFSDKTLQEGFLEFVLLSTCQTFNALSAFGNLTASFSEEAPIKEGLCIDVAIQLGPHALGARIVTSDQTLTEFRSYFAIEKPQLLQDPQLATLPLPLSYTVGETQLSASQWKEAKEGDCLLLDRWTFSPKEGKGTAILSVGTAALFDVRIKGEEAKILDYAMTQKETPMTEEDLTPPQEQDQPLAEEPEAKPLSADEIPLTLTVELGRFQMPLEQVTQLKPGNVLDLNRSKRANVHLTVGGKSVAIGELVTLGETMGVKILKLRD